MGRETFRPVTRSMVARTVAGVPGYRPARADGTRRGGAVVTLPDGRTFSLKDMEVARRWQGQADRRELERAGQMRLPGTDLCPDCGELREPMTGLSVCLACARRCVSEEMDLLRAFIAEHGMFPGPLWGRRQGPWCPDCWEDTGGRRMLARNDERCPDCALSGRRSYYASENPW